MAVQIIKENTYDKLVRNSSSKLQIFSPVNGAIFFANDDKSNFFPVLPRKSGTSTNIRL
jgi:hypothetical protein